MARGDANSRGYIKGVRRAADGTYAYRFYRAAGEQRIFKGSGYSTSREAMRAKLDREEEAEATLARGPIITFAQAARAFLTERRANLAPKTHAKYEHALSLMERRWRDRPLDSLTASDVEAYRAARLAGQTRKDGDGSRIKGATANRDLTALSALLNWARRKPRRWVTENVASTEEIERYDEPWRPYQTVTPSELETIRATLALHDKEAPAKVELLYLLGVRLQVVLGLEWDRVDLEHATIQYRSKGRDLVRHLEPRAAEVLRAIGPKPTGFVWADRGERAVRSAWAHARRTIGKPTLRLHDLRVTFAREHADAGVDLSTIRDMLGHSTLVMTQRYIPATLRAQAAAALARAQAAPTSN